MSRNIWWPEFRKKSEALEKLDHIPEVITRNLHATTRLFILLMKSRTENISVTPGQIEGLCKAAEELLREMKILQQHARQEQSRKFYATFCHT
ncbi:MAG: hypothetical protein HOB38_23800, partial [Deltaproteobacteria bacterium]|nr:hypothetical protein [Deltaproteobacteria bacterium]